jgi:hypothetical protein
MECRPGFEPDPVLHRVGALTAEPHRTLFDQEGWADMLYTKENPA